MKYNKQSILDEVTRKLESGRLTNSEQRAYMLAKAHLQALKDFNDEIEKEYIAAKGIRNADGTIPEQVWRIEDKETFDQASGETSTMIENCGLWADILEAEAALKAAEDVLIAFGLGIAPASVRATLERGVKENYTVRQKVIETTFRLDPSTITKREKMK